MQVSRRVGFVRAEDVLARHAVTAPHRRATEGEVRRRHRSGAAAHRHPAPPGAAPRLLQAPYGHRPRLSASVARLLRPRPEVGLARHHRPTMQPDIEGDGRVRTDVLRPGLHDAHPGRHRAVSVSLPLVLLRQVSDVRATGGGEHLQLSVSVSCKVTR